MPSMREGAFPVTHAHAPARPCASHTGGMRPSHSPAAAQAPARAAGHFVASDPPHSPVPDLIPDLISGWCTHLLVERGLQPLSIGSYRADLQQFLTHLSSDNPARTLHSATRHDLQSFLAALSARGLSPRAASRKLSSLRGFYRWLLRSGFTQADPTLHLSSPSGWRVLPKAISEQVVSGALSRAASASAEAGEASVRQSGEQATAPAFAQPKRAPRQEKRTASSGTPTPDIQATKNSLAEAVALRDHAILEVLYAAGLRASEATALTVAGVQLSVSQLRVVGKGNRERIVPIGQPAVVALQRYLSAGRPRLLGRASPASHLFPRGPRSPPQPPVHLEPRQGSHRRRRKPPHAAPQLRHPYG